MRLAVALLAGAAVLSACTSSPLDEMNRIAATSETEPYPAGYKVILQKQLGLNRAEDLLISEPRRLPAGNAFDPSRWYVCIETNAGVRSIHVLRKGRVEGTIRIPATPEGQEPQPNLCDGGSFSPLG